MANDSFINSDLFRKEAVSAHKNRISGVVLLSPTVSHTWISIVVLTFSLILITFLCFASYSEQVKVSGWIEPKEGLTSVYSERHGHITSILVVVGQEVSAGDSLMSIGVVDSQSNKRKDYLIQSPVDGIITHINFDAGQLYSNNAPLVAIWPRSSTLVAKLLIPVAASGQIAEGQSVKLQYDAFPVRRFGLQGATIVWVAPTPIAPGEARKLPFPVNSSAYIVEAELDNTSMQAYGKDIPLKPGMSLSADIHVRSRSLYEWIFDPILVLADKI